jgi:hypothetical protein
MDEDRWGRLRELFAEAQELPTQERRVRGPGDRPRPAARSMRTPSPRTGPPSALDQSSITIFAVRRTESPASLRK